MLKFFFNPYVLLGITLALAASFGTGYFKGFSDGETSEISQSNKEKQVTIDENIQVRIDQDRVVRPSDRAYVNSLRDGSF